MRRIRYVPDTDPRALRQGLGVAGAILGLGLLLVSACCGALTALAWIAEGFAQRLP